MRRPYKNACLKNTGFRILNPESCSIITQKMIPFKNKSIIRLKILFPLNSYINIIYLQCDQK
jgi:hypothetical protein